MKKSDIVNKLASASPKLQKTEVKYLVDGIIALFANALIDDGRIEIRGLGSFSIKKRKLTIIRNPKDNTKVLNPVAYECNVYFRPGKELAERINAGTNAHSQE